MFIISMTPGNFFLTELDGIAEPFLSYTISSRFPFLAPSYRITPFRHVPSSSHPIFLKFIMRPLNIS